MVLQLRRGIFYAQKKGNPASSIWGNGARGYLVVLAVTLSGCFHAPYNNFQPDQRGLRNVAIRSGIGAGTGALVGSAVGNTAVGAVIGGATGAAIGLYRNNLQSLIKEMQGQNMQYIAYGDTMTLIVPTDVYYQFNSARLNDLSYPGLNNIVKLLSYYPSSPVFVAGFTDNEGSRYHKKRLSDAQAETMLTFLWANNIPAQLLHAQGYGDQHDIGDNHWIRGSAYNRRIEIQWFHGSRRAQPLCAPYASAMK
jgi:outer membrane protein OmpA-like peptidoglycan-associated protein